jgi:OFA family oxalate/formate antiporter-like MFS transporter
VVGAFGLGTFVWAPAAQALLDAGTHWTRVFLLFGLSALVVLPLLSLGIRSPWRRHQRPGEHAGASGLSLGEALRAPLFWLVFAAYTLVTTAGLMWFAHFKVFGVSQGMTAAQAAFLASLTAVGGALGRVLMGYASDHIGRFPSLIGASALEVGLFVGFGLGVPHAAIFAFAALSGFAFGTWLALYGPTSTDLFGMRSAGSIYGALYLSYGIGGLAGPMLGGLLADLSGDYALAFFVMAGVCAAGGALFLLAMLRRPPQFAHPPAAEEEFPV